MVSFNTGDFLPEWQGFILGVLVMCERQGQGTGIEAWAMGGM